MFAFSFVFSRSNKLLVTNCAARHLTIMNHIIVSNNDSPWIVVYDKCSLSVSYVLGSVPVGDTVVIRNKPYPSLGLASNEGR